MPKDYKDTLNLPSTDFPMRANLPNKEPEIKQKWDDMHLYEQLLARNEGKPLFVLHDGPPFSNGNIHMGTAMNKILKDFINKSKSMSGYRTPYIPGWDNHGMPIESAIIKKSKLDRKRMSVPEFREKCREFASQFVDLQRSSFRRLGVLGDWDHPYLTMDPAFEAREIRVFGEMFRKGYIYKSLKPVYWCAHDETALAEAEIEYQDDPCTSIYVKFAVKDDKGVLGGIENTYFIIWTTTTWTLPGNLAIALHPREDYAVLRAADGNRYIVMASLAEKVMRFGGVSDYTVEKNLPGSAFEFMTAQHPFLARESLVVNAEYVTSDSGTGCVHTAPGFGADDYLTGLRYKLPILVPVDDKGYQTADAGKFAGMRYDESNKAILDELKQSGALFASEEIRHTYPHCWRCNHPIIFRATPQWFCSVDAFKEQTVAACADVDWNPKWGGDRMVSMIRERADWCISRQRHWGLPIPVFYCEDCGEIICNDATINHVSELFAAHGSNAWFEREAADLLPEGFVCPKCGKTHFRKESDTLDGWFDSGCTHFVVLENNPDLAWPADLYLEGGDQYRGWFQSSLLTAVAVKNQGAPYKAVLTSGWVVDGEGKAMHKSLGNSILAEDVVKQYGADILRLWVAASDYTVDVRASDAILKQLSEAYRKIRNTLRFLLANLGVPSDTETRKKDFDPDTDCVPLSELCEIDQWAVSRVNKLAASASEAYAKYDFHTIYHDILNFCSVDLSKLYLDITKDRLYCEKTDSPLRRSAQTATYLILNTVIRVLAPILSYTAEEAWSYFYQAKADAAESVFLAGLPGYRKELDFSEIEERYDRLFDYRDDVMKALELERAEKRIGKSLDAHVVVYAPADNEAMQLFRAFEAKLPEIFITSGVTLENDVTKASANAHRDTLSGIVVDVLPAKGEKCCRCWISYENIGADEEGQPICERCKKTLC